MKMKKKFGNLETLNSTKLGMKWKSKISESGGTEFSEFSANIRDFKVNPAHAHLFQIDPKNGKISITPRRNFLIPADEISIKNVVGIDFNANFQSDQQSGPIDMVKFFKFFKIIPNSSFDWNWNHFNSF